MTTRHYAIEWTDSIDGWLTFEADVYAESVALAIERFHEMAPTDRIVAVNGREPIAAYCHEVANRSA
jgi:hypothetical protein